MPFHIVTVFGLLGAGAIAVVFPETTNEVANFVGVGRGADLVTYTAIVAVMFVLLHYYSKFVELQRQLTEVTREQAVMRSEMERIARAAGTSPPLSTATSPPQLDAAPGA